MVFGNTHVALSSSKDNNLPYSWRKFSSFLQVTFVPMCFIVSSACSALLVFNIKAKKNEVISRLALMILLHVHLLQVVNELHIVSHIVKAFCGKVKCPNNRDNSIHVKSQLTTLPCFINILFYGMQPLMSERISSRD